MARKYPCLACNKTDGPMTYNNEVFCSDNCRKQLLQDKDSDYNPEVPTFLLKRYFKPGPNQYSMETRVQINNAILRGEKRYERQHPTRRTTRTTAT